jgi:hypothetical protein
MITAGAVIEDDFDLRMMSDEDLDKVPSDIMYWICQGKGCNCYSRVKTYGDFPFFRFRKEWIPMDGHLPGNWLMCGKHYKLWKRLTKNFDKETVYRKIMKPYLMSLMPNKPVKKHSQCRTK